MPRIFHDRRDAGRAIAQALRERNEAGRLDTLVLALPRGGVPVAYEVAEALDAPLDLMLVRKLGVPGHEELAMGAIASGGVLVTNDNVIQQLGLGRDAIERAAERERLELRRREQAYRGDRTPPRVEGREVILVDDGLATGSTMLAAVRAIRQLRPARIVVAVPVAPAETCAAFENEVDEIICAATPQDFFGVGAWYEDFEQTTDEEVRELLRRSWETHDAHAAPPQEHELHLGEAERYAGRTDRAFR